MVRCGGLDLSVVIKVFSAYSRQCVQQVCGGGRVRKKDTAGISKPDVEHEREEFDALIRFLAVVPLFQKLPKAELPRLAKAMEYKTWMPGDTVVEQGKMATAFYVVHEGEGLVTVKDAEGESERATLYFSDYFGGTALIEHRENPATVSAKGPAPLVTLSMERAQFERLGLHNQLKFPKRPAFYDGRVVGEADVSSGKCLTPQGELSITEADKAFISKVIEQDANFRTRSEMDGSVVTKLAQAARQRCISEGSDILTAGEVAQEFIIVKSGSFKLIPRAATSSAQQSLESRLASSGVTDRLGRKQQFLLDVSMRSAHSLVLSSDPSSCPVKKWSGSLRRCDTSGVAEKQVSRNFSRTSTMMIKSYSEEAEETIGSGDSPFKVGDRVSRLNISDVITKEVGEVVEIISDGRCGEVAVDFGESRRRHRVFVRHLRPEKEDPEGAVTLTVGSCCGEVELLYNMPQMATCRALEDSEVFSIRRADFKEIFAREPPHFKENCALLHEVHMLSALLVSQRAELARNAVGRLTFRAGEKVLGEGQEQTQLLWYVVEKGSCVMSEVDEEAKPLHRADHFGEELILGRGHLESTVTPNYTVTAGPAGVTCLIFPGELLTRLLLRADGDDKSNLAFSPKTPVVDKSLSTLPFEELKAVALLGEGGFGSVFLVGHEGKEYALKRMSKGYIVKGKMTKQTREERNIFSMVNSPFIIQFYRSYQDAQYVYMLMEFAWGGHLWGLMRDYPSVFRSDNPRGSSTMFYVACMTQAFDHLHQRHIVYRDLKPENILLDSQGYAKLCDLGLARFVLSKTNTLVGTPEYMAPEMIDAPHDHDCRADWWTLGVLTFELMTGQLPWDDLEAADAMEQILAIRMCQEDGIPDVGRLLGKSILIKDFIQKLLVVNENKRMGSKRGGAEIREHPWFGFQKFDFSALEARKLSSPWSPMQKFVENSLPEDWSLLKTGEGTQSGDLFSDYTPDGTDWDADF